MTSKRGRMGVLQHNKTYAILYGCRFSFRFGVGEIVREGL